MRSQRKALYLCLYTTDNVSLPYWENKILVEMALYIIFIFEKPPKSNDAIEIM